MMTDQRLAPRSTERPSAARAREDEELRALVERIALGDQDAMTRLYDATNRIVFALVLRIVDERDLAEEVLLDVFLQVWSRASTFDASRGGVSTWLLTIARSRALDRRRTLSARAQRERPWSDALDDELVDQGGSVEPGRVHADREERGTVRSAIAALPESQREAVELAFLGELSHTQIAERLGQPLGTVKTRIRLGMQKLREVLRNLEDVR